MTTTYSKTITEADIVLFAAVSGDNNAVHTNEEYAATTIFNLNPAVERPWRWRSGLL